MATTAEPRYPAFGEETRRQSRLWLPPTPRRRSEQPLPTSPAPSLAALPPAWSGQPSSMRTSLRKLSEGRKARRLTFFRNGDRFARGFSYALSVEKVRTFDALLEDLTRVMIDLPMVSASFTLPENQRTVLLSLKA